MTGTFVLAATHYDYIIDGITPVKFNDNKLNRIISNFRK